MQNPRNVKRNIRRQKKIKEISEEVELLKLIKNKEVK